jgi:hypothetical protein
MQIRFHTALPFVLTMLLFLAGCATSPDPATVIRTVYDPNQDGFGNFLVISVAGDFASRAAFERELSAEISSGNVNAAPYFTVIGRNARLSRAYILDAIRVRQFDGVIFTRLKGQEQEDLAPNRPVGAALDLFGYDYDELNRDVAIQQARAITFVTEVYSTATQKKIWAIETLSIGKDTAAELISEQAFTVAEQLREDDLLGL